MKTMVNCTASTRFNGTVIHQLTIYTLHFNITLISRAGFLNKSYYLNHLIDETTEEKVTLIIDIEMETCNICLTLNHIIVAQLD